jgi:Matrixin
VEGISEGAVAGATLEVAGLGTFTTGSNGSFRIEAADPESIRAVTITSSAIVERTTHVRIPGPDAQLTVIPGSFDLRAFDQMFRPGGRLQRWVERPRLSIQRAVLQFTDVTAQQYVATDQTMSDDEVALLSEDLAWGIPRLTDGQLAFESEQQETASSGASLTVARLGEIVVARFTGLRQATGFWGYGRWASDGTGRIQGGIVMLDSEFDSSGSEFRRSLRVHELGHALGYNHVTLRESVMNATARSEPNEFDLNGARLAFLRPPGNRTPDTDPDAFTSNIRTGVVIWSGDR